MRLGLKAQNQCRMTLETLAQIKNPAVVFARQANIAQGPQQVNNGMMPVAEPRAGAGKTEKPQNKLLEAQNGERLDFGAQGAAVDADPQLGAVAGGDGPKSEEGKARVSRNAYKGGTRAILRELARLLREQVKALKRCG